MGDRESLRGVPDMRVTLEQYRIPQNATATIPDTWKCVALAEGEQYLVEEFYQYVAKFGDRYSKITKELCSCEGRVFIDFPHLYRRCCVCGKKKEN